jgi:hypothetical protein
MVSQTPPKRDKGDRGQDGLWTWTVFGCVQLVPSHPATRQARRRDLDERLAGLDYALVVLAQPPIAQQPGETPFDHPSARLDTEAMGAWLALLDLQLPTAVLYAPLGQLLAPIGCIRPDPLEAGREEGKPTTTPMSSACSMSP